jgi:hypothetical protein
MFRRMDCAIGSASYLRSLVFEVSHSHRGFSPVISVAFGLISRFNGFCPP